MEYESSSKIKIKKLSLSSKIKKENSFHSIKNNIKQNNYSFNKTQSSKQIRVNNKLFYKDPLKQKILNKIKKAKSRQNIFSKTQYLFYGKDENNIKKNTLLKSIIEMENKFNMRNKEGLKCEYNSDPLLKLLSKEPSKYMNKIILNYGHFITPKSRNSLVYEEDKGSLELNMKRSKSNIFSPFNSRTVKNKLNTIRVSPKIIRSIKSDKRLSFFASDVPLFNLKTPKMNKNNGFINEKGLLNLDNVVNHNVSVIKKILKDRAKKKSKILCDSINTLGKNNLPYELIDPRTASNKVWKKIYINNANLSRLINLMKTVKKGYYEDDLTNNINGLKSYSKNSTYINRSIKDNFLSKLVKNNHFSKSTIFRYNQSNGYYFGLP